MKLFYRYTFLTLGVILYGSAYSQIPTSSIDQSFFSKGTSLINLIQDVGYTQLKTNQDNPNTTKAFDVRLRGNYFVADNIGVVAGVHVENSYSKREMFSNEDINNYGLFEIGAIYGFQPEFLNNTPLSAQLTFGFGSANFDGTKAGLFATQVTLSSYHQVNQSGLTVSPFIGYGYLNQNFKDSDFKTNSNGFLAGVTLVKPFSCEEWICGFDREAVGDGYYDKGTNIINFSQSGLFSIGTTKSNSDFDSPLTTTNFTLRSADLHYVANNVAVGAGIDLSTQTNNNKENDWKVNLTDFTFMPMVRVNAPVDGALNHLYLDGSFVAGVSSTTVTNNGNKTETKNDIIGWEVDLGYNIPFTDRLSFSLQAGYLGTTVENKENETKFNNNGWRFLYGLSYKAF
jgi:hypothetical protein